ncbi:MAG: hypothetical protein IKF91_02865 [Bacilli bacterium]|nr:hypothetical protein [Bacilli bacterium]
MKKNIFVEFPFDRRPDILRNELLDGQNHEIDVEQIKTFFVGDLQFYICNGFDITRNSYVTFLLLSDGKSLKKVPLFDYSELKKYEKMSRTLSQNVLQELINKYGRNISAMELTTLDQVIEQSKKTTSEKEEEEKQKIIIFYDLEGRKFILSSAAKSLGLPNPVSIKYLPFRKKYSTPTYIHECSGFRLLTESEYNEIVKKYIIDKYSVSDVDILKYEDEYFVRRIVFEGNEFGLAHLFYDFGDDLFDCVPLNDQQYKIINKFYVTNEINMEKLKRTVGDLSSPVSDWEENHDETTIPLVDATATEEYENERQRIMKARFSEEDKQRLLKELEEEYRNNNFVNNSGRPIR